MKKVSIKEAREIMLSMLEKFNNFCKKNKLQYWLESGTMLGAIRHKGFIPWDDDMDVGMPRPDYDKFLEITSKQNIDDNIEILLPEQNLFPYIKIYDNRTLLIEYPKTLRSELGIYIDIFPKDGLPDDKKKAEKLCSKVAFYNNLYWFNKYSVIVWKKDRNILKRIIAFMASPFCKGCLFPLRKSLELTKSYDYNKSKYIATILAGGMKNAVERKCFDSFIDVEFEGKMYPVPIGYDTYLKKLYSHINNGDYMRLPPENQKIIHDVEIYLKE